MSDVKLYLRFKEWNEYYEAVHAGCDACGKVFQVKKGFQLVDGFLTCYKHLELRDNSSTKKELIKSRVPVCESPGKMKASGVPK